MQAKLTIRIDKTISHEIQMLCCAQEVSRDAFLEALLMQFQEQPELFEPVIARSRVRHKERKATSGVQPVH